MGGSKIAILVAIVVVLGIGGAFVLMPKPQPPAEPVLTAEARTYLPSLALSDVDMKAADSVINLSLTEITGKITNNGPRTVSVIEVNCVFHDPSGQVIKRERVTVVGRRTGPLAPGATKSFHLNFDNIPDTWNQALPALVIAQIQFS